MKIKAKRQIDAPSEALWNYLADFSNIHKFHPLLKGSSYIEGTESCEVGGKRQCDMKDGNILKETIIDIKEGSHYTVEIYETSMPIKNAVATLGVRPLGEKKSEAYMHVGLIPKYRILAPFMYLFFKFVAAPSILKGLEKIHKKEATLKLA
ncbi:MAG: SRPBCC family protein [Bacteroidota bacterium]